ncbi:MAG: type II toxin-antitoxin system Phd/YefM family antitoxin [Lachnospiraceae bacterium]|nr:type II toxin-antitoxin system Phd/YefM family antitoxin [Lachnospiraceae bacterium]
MQIVPIRDMKNTVEIEKKCANGPVFVTKNGYGRLVVMDIDYYEKRLAQTEEADFVNQGLADFAAGRVKDGKTAVNEVRAKYGI